MGEFFAARPANRAGLALFLNAGDPPLSILGEVLRALDDARVDCVELAVPFPNSVTDGPVIRRSAERALVNGANLERVLATVRAVRPQLRHTRIALLADWSYTVKPLGLPDFVSKVHDAGADGLLVHAIPPRLRQHYYDTAHAIGMPIVTTCYRNSTPELMAEAAMHATAYLYLTAHYGRSGQTPPDGFIDLASAVAALRAKRRKVPIAIGFGVRSLTDVDEVHRLGADAAIVGTAGVARVEHALVEGRNVIDELRAFVRELQPTREVAFQSA